MEPENARAHFLVGDPNPLPEYLWLEANASKGVPAKLFVPRFRRWTEKRTRLIATGFRGWFDELIDRCRESVSPHWPDVSSDVRHRLRLEPVLSRHPREATAPTFIRQLGLDPVSEDNLIAVSKGAGFDGQTLRVNLAERSCVWLEATPGSIRMRVRLKASEARTGVFQAMMLFFLLATDILVTYRLRLRRPAHGAA